MKYKIEDYTTNLIHYCDNEDERIEWEDELKDNNIKIIPIVEYDKIIFAQMNKYGASFLVTLVYEKSKAEQWLAQDNNLRDYYDEHGFRNILILHEGTLANEESVTRIRID